MDATATKAPWSSKVAETIHRKTDTAEQSLSQTNPTVRAIIGTAGHVDHGKTTLVGHLTGIETDRLREEKSRGISIELGFAWLDRGEDRIGVIDVPGHERFVRQMIAGAVGVDLVLLVVAADEGMMPQTREHLDICELLGVRAGAIVITKCDLVEDDWRELVCEDVREEVAGTFLEHAPMTCYSAGDVESLTAVRKTIDELLLADEHANRAATDPRSPDRPFKLSIDRRFTMRGFGTVLTGTTTAGTMRVGDSVELLPSGHRGRVRGLQVHEQSVDELGPGLRAAINVQGIELSQVHRGDVLVRKDEGLGKTSMFDGTFRALRRLENPVEDRTRVLVHVGTAQVQGTLNLLGCARLEAGESTPVQIRLDHPIAVLPGEPYVVRGFAVLAGYGQTIGGGKVMTASVRRHKGKAEDGVSLVNELASGSPRRIIEAYVRYQGEAGANHEKLGAHVPLTQTACEHAVNDLLADQTLMNAGSTLIHSLVVAPLADRALAIVSDYHQQFPARAGVLADELRTRVRATLSQELWATVLTTLVNSERVQQRDQMVCAQGFEAKRNAAQSAACDQVLKVLSEAGMSPPRVQDLPELTGLASDAVQEALSLLYTDGSIQRVNQDLSYPSATLEKLKAELLTWFESHETINTAGFKQLTGTTRKWTIPLQEHFDRVKFTLRVGDERRLRR